MILAAHQPQYLAYTGYFDKIDQADIFILLDTVQYKKNEWINRNRIKGPEGEVFLTVPVSFNFGDSINQVKISADKPWKRKHLGTIDALYAKASYKSKFRTIFEELLSEDRDNLAELNINIIKKMVELLDINNTEIFIASELDETPDHPDLRLIEYCRRLKCQTYLAGAGGRDYMNMNYWKEAGIEVRFQDFLETERLQLYEGFIPNLSIADLYMNLGPEASNFLREIRIK